MCFTHTTKGKPRRGQALVAGGLVGLVGGYFIVSITSAQRLTGVRENNIEIAKYGVQTVKNT